MSAPAEKLFDDIAQFISDSRSLLEQGALMELAGLDDQVRTLCEMVLDLSQDDRLRYADRLQYLLGELKALGETMAAQKEQIAKELSNISSHKKATVAYKVVDASDDFGNRDDDEGQ